MATEKFKKFAKKQTLIGEHGFGVLVILVELVSILPCQKMSCKLNGDRVSTTQVDLYQKRYKAFGGLYGSSFTFLLYDHIVGGIGFVAATPVDR